MMKLIFIVVLCFLISNENYSKTNNLIIYKTIFNKDSTIFILPESEIKYLKDNQYEIFFDVIFNKDSTINQIANLQINTKNFSVVDEKMKQKLIKYLYHILQSKKVLICFNYFETIKNNSNQFKIIFCLSNMDDHNKWKYNCE